jgi:prevent-host-death family protein
MYRRNATLSGVATTAFVPMRELRNHTSGVIKRVEAGEVIQVTVYGRPVIELRPLSERSATAWLDDLVASDTGWPESLQSERAADLALDWAER